MYIVKAMHYQVIVWVYLVLLPHKNTYICERNAIKIVERNNFQDNFITGVGDL